MSSFRRRVKERLAQTFPPAEGWRVEDQLVASTEPGPHFLVRRGRHVVVVAVRDAPVVRLEDVSHVDRMRYAHPAIDAVLYVPATAQMPAEVCRHATRLGVRIIALPGPPIV